MAVPFDYLGLLYSAVAIVTLTYSIIALQHVHLAHWFMLSIFLFILASMAFVWQQKHATHPLIPNHLFKNKRFLAYNAISFILGFAGYSSLFGGVSKSMLKKSRLDFDKIEKCE